MTFCYCGDFLHASTWVYKGLIQNLCWKIPLSWEGGSLGSGVWSALMITVVLLPCEGKWTGVLCLCSAWFEQYFL